MKISSSILVTMALLAMTTLRVDADRYFVPIHGHGTGDSYSYEPVYISKSHRSLRSMDSSKQGPLDDGKNPKQQHHLPLKDDNLQGPRALAEGDAASPAKRALGQSPVTPAPTTTKHSTKATPAPTKTHTPKPTTSTTNTSKVTPAPTKPKVTPAATTTSTSDKKMHVQTTNTPKSMPIVTKKTVVSSTPPPTTAASSTSSNKPLSGAQQQHNSRNLGDNQAKQQPPHHHMHDGTPSWKDNGKQH